MKGLCITSCPGGNERRIILSEARDRDMFLDTLAEMSHCFERDLLISMLWQSGQLTNPQIGEKFGLTYSAVSRKVGAFKDLLRKYRRMQNRLNQVKTLIKI
jgi:hypothetical protein